MYATSSSQADPKIFYARNISGTSQKWRRATHLNFRNAYFRSTGRKNVIVWINLICLLLCLGIPQNETCVQFSISFAPPYLIWNHHRILSPNCCIKMRPVTTREQASAKPLRAVSHSRRCYSWVGTNVVTLSNSRNFVTQNYRKHEINIILPRQHQWRTNHLALVW